MRNRQVSDTELLDYLDSLDYPDNDRVAGWVLRESSTGRGYRLHMTSREPNYTTAREAILAAMPDG